MEDCAWGWCAETIAVSPSPRYRLVTQGPAYGKRNCSFVIQHFNSDLGCKFVLVLTELVLNETQFTYLSNCYIRTSVNNVPFVKEYLPHCGVKVKQSEADVRTYFCTYSSFSSFCLSTDTIPKLINSIMKISQHIILFRDR